MQLLFFREYYLTTFNFSSMISTSKTITDLSSFDLPFSVCFIFFKFVQAQIHVKTIEQISWQKTQQKPQSSV